MTRSCGVFLFLMLGTFWAAGLEAEEAPDPETLVKRLGADDFDERQEAAEKLEALGETARAALEKARGSDLLEVRAIAARLLSLLKRAKLSLRFVDENGKPWPNLSVNASLQPFSQNFNTRAQMMAFARRQGKPNETLETDADGTLELVSPAPGLHQLSVVEQNRPWNWNVWQPQPLNLRSGENRAYWIRPRGATVSGAVVADETGQPVADAEVMIRRDDGIRLRDLLAQWWTGQPRSSIVQGNTDAQGAFSVQNVGPSSARVYVRHTDYVPVEGPNLMITDSRPYAVEQPIRLQLKSKAWGRLRMQVLDSAGKPAENAKVQVHLFRLGDDDAQVPSFADPRERQVALLDTDKEGYFQTDYLEPGTYQVRVTSNVQEEGQEKASRIVTYDAVEVKPGATVSVAGRTPPKTGALTGRFKSTHEFSMSPLRVLALRTDDPRVEQYLKRYKRLQPWEIFQFTGDNRNQQYIHSNKDYFEFSNLQPGHYALVLHSMRDQRFGWIFDLDVKPGETTTIPDIDLAVAEEPEDQTRPSSLRGTVVDEKGRLIDQLQWTVRGTGFSTSSSTNGGRFQIDLRSNGKATSVTFTCPGYRPFKIDLRKPIADPAQMVVQMQPQGYGAVQVKVLDPDGRPLENARVTPVSAVNGLPSYYRSRDTDPDGVAKLQGLAYGKRSMVVDLEGYYLDQPLRVDVELDQTSKIDVTMKPGQTLNGHVTLPAGVSPDDVLVWVASLESPNLTTEMEAWRSTGVNADGDFECPGLAPGKVKLKAQAPGMIGDEWTATVGQNEKIELHLFKPVSLVIDAGEAGKGGNLWLLKTGTLKPAQNIYSLFQIGTPVDALGHAVLGDLVPGTYDLLFAEKTMRTRSFRGQASMQIIASGIVVAPNTTATQAVKWHPGNASVSLIPRMDGETSERIAAQSVLLLESETAFATIFMSPNYALAPPKPWFVRGTPPEGFLSESKPEGIAIDGLPAGEYKLQICARSFQHRSERSMFQQARLIKTFTLKEGEALDLGTIALDAPADRTAGDDVSGEEIGEDEGAEE